MISIAHGVPIGREKDLTKVESFLSAVHEGFGLIVLEGDAGIGKTTLWEVVMSNARARGMQTLIAHPSEAEATLSFVGLNDLVSFAGEEVWSEIPAPQRAALQAALLLAPAGTKVESGAVALAFLSLTRVLAGRSPVVVGVDDYQWLDRPSARVLEFALRRLTSEPVRAVVTSRPGGGETWEHTFGRERVTRLVIGPLSLSALYQLIYQRFGVPLGRPTLLRLHETSQGNPFFALELARELFERREEDYRGRPLPLSEQLNELLSRRLGRQPAPMRHLLVAIAAMSSPRLAELLLVAEGERIPEPMIELERAESAGIIEINEDEVRFAHPILAAAAYAAAPRSMRDRVHSRLAAVVTDPEEGSRHLALSTHPPDEQAAAQLDDASTRAQSRGATDVAALFADQSLRLTHPLDRPGIFRRALNAGALTLAAGNQTRARELFDRALTVADAGAQRALALLRRAELASPLREATTLCEQALMETSDSTLRSRIHSTLGAVSYALGEVASAEHHARQAVELAQHGADHATLGAALAELAHWTFCGGGGYREELFEQAVALDGSAGAASPRSHYAKITLDAGHLEKARGQLTGLLEEATEHGDLQGVAAHHLHIAELELWQGNWQKAIEHADESLLLHEYSDQPGAPRHVKAMAQACRGEVDRARQEAAAGLTEAEKSENLLMTIYNLHVLGFVELSLGLPEDAQPHLARAIELHRPRWNHEFGDAHFVPDQVETLVALGDLAQAEDLVVWMEQVGEATRRTWTQATGARSRGLLLAAQGCHHEAEAALLEALHHHWRLPMPFELARTYLVYGALQRRRKQWASATETLRQAQDIFTSLGSGLWAAKAASESARIGSRFEAQQSLTPIEDRIAGLASQGRSNREIADLLFISRKTVEANLTHIYRKLGIRSRAQLGTVLAQSGNPMASK